MKRITRNIIIVFVSCILLLSGCQKKEEVLPSIEDYPIEHEEEFGGVYIKISIDDFNELGFEYGDSVNVYFDNGYKLEDLPYYNGYYVDPGQPLLVGYPGYEYIKAGINYGDDLWNEFNLQMSAAPRETLWLTSKLEEHNKATITLNEKHKYLNIQNASDIHYYDEREKYESDEIFANFRAMNVGNLKENIIYRSASPCDNQHNRATYVDKLIENAGVKTILNLSDNYMKIEKYISAEDFGCPYFLDIYNEGNVVAIALNMNYFSDDFAMKIVQGFNEMADRQGPYLIHCTEGKDRTGFVAMLIEALCGTSYNEIIDDYMLTYDNYYKINKTNDPEKYETILNRNIISMIRYIVDDESVDIENCDLSLYARNYLKKYEMSDEQIDRFIDALCK